MPHQFMSRYFHLVVLIVLLGGRRIIKKKKWTQLPPTPELPKPDRTGMAAVNGIKIWYAIFGQGEPVVFIHGGMGSSNYWGLQVPAVARRYQVIVLDSRGQGRSTWNSEPPISFHLMASDVLAVMDALHIPKAALVGWSDGAIIGLDIAILHPERLTKLFAFAANSDPSGSKTALMRKRLFRDTSAG